jgi:CheY-like chemotaxis protein
MRVLIVDDNETLARAIKRMLAGTGRVEVVTETDPLAAIARVIGTAQCRERFDVVLCDSRMPGATAHDVLAVVRAHGEAVFVLMSGDDHLVEADANLTKPFSRADLMHVLDELVERRDGRPGRSAG